MSSLPTVIHLVPATVRRRDGVLASFLCCAPGRADAGRIDGAFGLCEDERSFVRELLRARPQFWVFRSNQHAFCGDFVLVDMSSPRRERRAVFVLDLKRGAALREGGGGAGVQLTRARAAVDEIAARWSAIAAGACYRLITGDRRGVIAFLGERFPVISRA